MIIIGERVNATRKSIREAIQSKDSQKIKSEITQQDSAGADYIDLNASTGTGSLDQEIDDLRWLIDVALDCTEKNLAIDSADLLVMKKAAEHLAGERPWLLNSIKGSPAVMDALLPLAATYNTPVIALAMDNTGIPKDAHQRMDVCREIFETASKAGILEENIFFDPLVLPLSADTTQGTVTLETLRGIKELFTKAKTTMGLSNISHGLPKRTLINQSFFITAISYGLDSVICDPTDRKIREATLLGELISGKDRHCRRFTRAVRNEEF